MKKPMTGLFRDNPATPEGKYLVKRRDGTVVEKPTFVLVATDPLAIAALKGYAAEGDRILHEEPERAQKLGLTWDFVIRITNLAREWEAYRQQHGDSDPGMGQHRPDDPTTVAEMKKALGS